jgi:hypothetical protein
VTTLCTYCGTPLPKEDARFCTNCGMLVPSHPFSPKAAPSPSSHANTVREQVAEQPHTPPRSVRYPARNEPPAWMSQLDSTTVVRPFTPLPVIPQTDGANVVESSDHMVDPAAAAWPNSLAEYAAKQPQGMGNQARANVENLVSEEQKQQLQRDNTPPGRELHVKIWGQEGQKRQEKREHVVEDVDVNDLPTRPLMAESPDLVAPRSSVPAPASQRRSLHGQDVEYLDTVPMATPKRTNPPSFPPESFGQQSFAPQQIWSQAEQQQQSIFSQPAPTVPQNPASQSDIQYSSAVRPTSYAQVNPASLAGQQHPTQLNASQNQERRQASSLAAMKTSKGKSRRPLVIALMLLLLLAIGAVATWIIQAQPFSVSSVTQPQETFSDTRLGFSLSYPNGWTAKANTGKGSVQLSDSSLTDQVYILTKSGIGGDLSQALQQEATQLKMTNQQKGLPPVAFASTTWQQLKGSIFVSGANYTGVILMTSHNNMLFTMVQMAPQATFSQEDQLVFASMRSSFRFLP